MICVLIQVCHIMYLYFCLKSIKNREILVLEVKFAEVDRIRLFLRKAVWLFLRKARKTAVNWRTAIKKDSSVGH